MQFIFNEDSNLYGYAGKDDEAFTFPSNIKQMGCMEDGIRIYVEDYVYTYLYQYAKSAGNKEKLAALAGRTMVVDGQDVIIISGAIQAKNATPYRGVLSFSDETWEYVNQQMDIYFKGLSLVGWVHTQPGFGTFMIAQDESFHKEYFKKSHQVLFVIDPLEKLDTFYIHNEEKTGLRAAKGYFVYYEKNEEMQEYMLDHNLGRQKITEAEKQLYNLDTNIEQEEMQQEDIAPKQERGTGKRAVERISAVKEDRDRDRDRNKDRNIDRNRQERSKDANSEMVSAIRKEGITKRKPTQQERMDAAKDIRRVLQKRAKEADEESRAKFNVLVGVSGVLCLSCLLMGSSLISNIGRLKKLESEIASVQHSYVAMAQKFETEKAQVVFAAQNPPLPIQITLPEPKKEVQAQTLPQQPTTENTTNAEVAPPEVVEEIKIIDSYVVEEGDTLGHISLIFYGNQGRIGDIMKANGISDANTIKIGQSIKIPE